jgi:hypothetical protein
MFEGHMFEPPADANILIKKMHMALMDVTHAKHEHNENVADVSAPQSTILAPEDVGFLASLLGALHTGSASVVIVRESDEKLRFLFANTSRADAIAMMGKVIEATAKRI